MDRNEIKLKPFVKWVGGKTQLLDDILPIIPDDIETYVEPFVGGGAVLSSIIGNKSIKKIYINDLNSELMNLYKVVRDNVDGLMSYLDVYASQFNAAESDKARSELYYIIRSEYNVGLERDRLYPMLSDKVRMTALVLFLNKTGFNGLYRVNRAGQFNVPFNHCKKVNLYDKDNLTTWHDLLQNVEFYNVSYEQVLPDIDYSKAFYYMDPPYKPITKTSAFTAYSKENFRDEDQENLKKFCDVLNERGCRFLQSNSEPGTGYFNELYKDYKIEHVSARRSINSNGLKRGKIDEILIRNY